MRRGRAGREHGALLLEERHRRLAGPQGRRRPHRRREELGASARQAQRRPQLLAVEPIALQRRFPPARQPELIGEAHRRHRAFRGDARGRLGLRVDDQQLAVI
ncbi:MAG: hypothetical protein IPI49_03410 [Myxococcales bacterium]|nr:hypothetical protein [Myxococcales bacterium]